MLFDVHSIDETDSTNKLLKEAPLSFSLLGEEVSRGLVVVADYQTAGCGQGTNRWESERGKNLTFSVRVNGCGLKANRQFLISMMVSVALTKTLAAYLPSPASIKWPNDIYVGDRKICGILIENTLQGDAIRSSIIGIGLNVNQTCFVSDAPNPTSMVLESGHTFDRRQVLDELLSNLGEMLDAPDAFLVRNTYRQHLYRREGFFPYSDARGTFQARLLTVEDDGRLVLQDTEGLVRTYVFKEVAFVI